MEKKICVVPNHSIKIDGKQKLEIVGAIEVLSSTEKEIIVKLESEFLHVFGRDLTIQKLSPEEKLLLASGTVDGLKYASRLTKKTLLSRVFK